jgi:hypothetical protein
MTLRSRQLKEMAFQKNANLTLKEMAAFKMVSGSVKFKVISHHLEVNRKYKNLN